MHYIVQGKKIHEVCYELEFEPSLHLLEGENFYNKSTGIDNNA